MADRKVSVGLELRASSFKAEATAVEAKVEGIDRKVDKLDRSITKIPPDAAKAAVAMKLLGAESGRASLQLDDLGHRSTAFQVVDQRIEHTRVQIARLADEFNRTGDVSFLERMFAGTRDLRQLERLKGNLTKALGDGARKAIPLVEDAIIDAGQGASRGFWAVFSSLPPQAQAAIAAAIASAIAASAVYIGATLGGALLAGVGAAGLGAAIAGQISNPTVAHAVASLKTDLGGMFKDITSPFEPVLIRSAGAFAAIVRELAPGLKSAFAASAPYAEAFLHGVMELGRNALPGLETAMVAGSKILARLGESDLPRLGQAIGDFFDSISRGGREGGDALSFLLGTLSATIRTLGVAIGIAETWYGIFEDIGGLIGGLATGNFALFTDRILAMGDSSNTTASSIKSVGGAAHFTEEAVQALSTAFDEMFGKTMGVDEAATRFATDLYGLKGALDSHSKSIDLNSAAGAHNREIIDGAIRDAKAHRDALIEQAGGAHASKAAIDAANKTYEEDIDKLKRMYVAAGGAARAFDDLAGNYTVRVVEQHVYESDYITHRQDERRASGGPVAAGTRYMVGERGPEMFVPRVSGTIVPNDRLRSTAQVAPARWVGGAGSAAGGGANVNVTLAVGSGVRAPERAVADLVHYAVRNGIITLAVDDRAGQGGRVRATGAL